MGGRKWTQEEIEFLRENVGKKKTIGKCKCLFFNIDEVLELSKTYKKQNNKKWCEYDEIKLITYYNNGLTYDEMSKKLNRTVSAIKGKVANLRRQGRLYGGGK